MPCASVSEKPTRVSAEYLNGGLAPVARPSSSLISRGILRVAPAALSVVSDTPRRSEATSRQMCRAYGAGMSAPLPSKRGPRAPSYRPRLPVSRRLGGQQWRADRARRIDYDSFCHDLDRIATKYLWEVWAWVLMPNHFPLVAQTPPGALSAGMQQLNGNNGRRMNRRHGREGHLVKNRFFSL